MQNLKVETAEVTVDMVAEVVVVVVVVEEAEAEALVAVVVTASSADCLATGPANAPLVGVTAVGVAATLVVIDTTVEATDMAEVIVMAVVEVVAVTAVVEAAIVMVTARGVRTVRMEAPMPERVVLITVVKGTAAEAVTGTQVVTAMPVPEEARPVTREVPETDQGLMTGPVVDPEVMMIVIEKRMICAGTRPMARCVDDF